MTSVFSVVQFGRRYKKTQGKLSFDHFARVSQMINFSKTNYENYVNTIGQLSIARQKKMKRIMVLVL